MAAKKPWVVKKEEKIAQAKAAMTARIKQADEEFDALITEARLIREAEIEEAREEFKAGVAEAERLCALGAS